MRKKELIFSYEHKLDPRNINGNNGTIYSCDSAYEEVYPLSPRGNHLRNYDNTQNIKIIFTPNGFTAEREGILQTVEEFVAATRQNTANKRKEGYEVRTNIIMKTEVTHEDGRVTITQKIIDEELSATNHPTLRDVPFTLNGAQNCLLRRYRPY